MKNFSCTEKNNCNDQAASLPEVAFLFGVRKFPTGKSELSGLLFPAMPGNIFPIIINRYGCPVQKDPLYSRASVFVNRAARAGRTAWSVTEKSV